MFTRKAQWADFEITLYTESCEDDSEIYVNIDECLSALKCSVSEKEEIYKFFCLNNLLTKEGKTFIPINQLGQIWYWYNTKHDSF